MKTLSMIVILMLVGCAVQPWTRADGTLATEREALECKHEADLATASRAGTPSTVKGGLDAFLTNPTFARAGLADDCMKLKGYERR